VHRVDSKSETGPGPLKGCARNLSSGNSGKRLCYFPFGVICVIAGKQADSEKGLLRDSRIRGNSNHDSENFWISGCLYSSRTRRRRGEGGGCREKEGVIEVNGGANSAKRTVESRRQIGMHRREQTAGRQVESRRQVGSNELLVTRAHVQTLIHDAEAALELTPLLLACDGVPAGMKQLSGSIGIVKGRLIWEARVCLRHISWSISACAVRGT